MADDLKVIPVIDILNGIVVHAVKGKRKDYQPLQSTLCKSVDSIEVAKTFKNLGFSELYVADLDAIAGDSVNFQVFKGITEETGLKLIVDAGVADIETAKKLLDCGVSKIVIGTETLRNKGFVDEAVRLFGSECVIISLDLKDEKVLVQPVFDGSKNPMRLLREFKEIGVSRVIVLDLTRVGSGEGVNEDFLKKVLKTVAMDVYAGGGVRDLEDLVKLKDLGVSGVLVATALHSGKISIEKLKQADLL
ncbi:MAG: HisA/HisF-related TIM barrel protein [Candidatus Bathyarchaeia archaeon]|jgi:phosphoribosylformimino-5-aminoimidazole carboxamide ribotide isomerase